MKINKTTISYSPKFCGYNNRETVAILGSSKETQDILGHMDICSKITKELVLSGKNVLTGCGSMGIMGASYNAAKEHSTKDGKGRPEQNLAITVEPLWGDEDLENCTVIAHASSEADRIKKFQQHADKFVIFPGSAGTLQEISTLIADNYYKRENKEIILVGKEFFKGIEEQYQKMYEADLIKCPPDKLFKLVDSEEEINEALK